VTIAATVLVESDRGGTPTGTVEFFEDATRLGAGDLAVGMATLTNAALPPGNHAIDAVYSGDAMHLSSTGTVSHTVLSLNDASVFLAGPVVSSGTRFLQTTLMTQLLTVTNVTSQTVSAVRITIHLGETERSANIRVYNASGTNTLGEPYLHHNFPVPPGDHVTFTVEYYSPDRVTVPDPAFTVELVPPEAIVAPPGTVQSVLRTMTLEPNNAFLIDFLTEAGADYHVLYKDEMAGTNWNVAQPPVRGTGHVVQWVDSGPPKTGSPPGPSAQRFYQILKAD
jgi:hypothetical protein